MSQAVVARCWLMLVGALLISGLRAARTSEPQTISTLLAAGRHSLEQNVARKITADKLHAALAAHFLARPMLSDSIACGPCCENRSRGG